MKQVQPLLEVEQLKVHFPIHGGVFYRELGRVHAVDGVSFKVKAGQTLGLVGESGCGKSTVGRALVKLYDPTDGRVLFKGSDITPFHGRALKAYRRSVQMIFQDPMESLNSRHSIEEILTEPLLVHNIGTKKERRSRIEELLGLVGLNKAALTKYPHEFSGGQRQRIGIARALTLQPELVVCDEPVSALDVSIQSQILNLLLKLQQDLGLSFVFIAHNLAVVRHISDQVAVMYLGQIVETAGVEDLFSSPLHPYTQALLEAIPRPEPSSIKRRRKVLKGEVPSPINPPAGCRFHTRCPYAKDICLAEVPKVRNFGSAEQPHQVACHFAGEL